MLPWFEVCQRCKYHLGETLLSTKYSTVDLNAKGVEGTKHKKKTQIGLMLFKIQVGNLLIRYITVNTTSSQ